MLLSYFIRKHVNRITRQSRHTHAKTHLRCQRIPRTSSMHSKTYIQQNGGGPTLALFRNGFSDMYQECSHTLPCLCITRSAIYALGLKTHFPARAAVARALMPSRCVTNSNLADPRSALSRTILSHARRNDKPR